MFIFTADAISMFSMTMVLIIAAAVAHDFASERQ